MYRIKSSGEILFDQLLIEEIVEKFDRGFLNSSNIVVERLNTHDMVWERVPLSKIFVREMAV